VSKTRRDHILAAASDLAGDLFYYGRKEDEDLPPGEIEAALASGEVTLDDIVAAFVASAKRNVAGL
jgi:hypothetical protein